MLKKTWFFVRRYWPGIVAGWVLKSVLGWLLWKHRKEDILALASLINPF